MMTSPLDHIPQSKRELLELQTAMFLGAPDNFFVLPGYPPEDQRNLEGTVGDMRRGIDHVYRQPRHAEVRARMHELVDKMYVEFKANRVSEGRATSVDFEKLVSQTRP